jgi:hypothetical protein
MVQKGKFSAGIASFVTMLKKVDLPTFGNPTCSNINPECVLDLILATYVVLSVTDRNESSHDGIIAKYKCNHATEVTTFDHGTGC